VSPLQVKFAKPVSEGPLLAIDPTELPAEFRLLSSAPTLAAWQYTARDFKIGMKIEWFEPGETVEQVVDFLKLSSQVSRDGQWVTDARFFVKSKGRSALRATLPTGASLWEAKVNGESVNARSDGGETLVPLPSQVDPNQAVEVTLRYGARADSPTRPRLAAPKLAAPVVIGEWTVTGDEGRQLVPRGGTAELVRPGLAESGWEWLARHSGNVGLLLLLGIVAVVLGRGQDSGVRRILSLLFGVVFILTALGLGLSAAATSRGNAAVLEYAAPVVAAGSEVAVEIGNVAPWQARTGWGMWLVFTLGAVIAVRGILTGNRWWKMGGLALTGAAFLSIRGGAALFFGIVASVALAWLLPRLWQAIHDLRKPKVAEVVAALLILTGFCFNDARAAEIPGTKPAESMIQDWQIRDGRLRGTIDVTLRGEAGDRFLLLRPPAVLSGFEGAGLHVVKAPLDDKDAYFIVADSAGRMTGKAVFEMPLTDPGKGWVLPGGPAALRQVTLRWDQAGWEFFSPGAAKVTTLEGLAANESGAVLVLGPADPVTLQARPKQRDVGSEETKFFAEVSNLYLPGPGVVNGRHRVSIRPAQGRVSLLVMTVTAGFRAGPGLRSNHRDPARCGNPADGSRPRTDPGRRFRRRNRISRAGFRRGSTAGIGQCRRSIKGEPGGFQRQIVAPRQGGQSAGAAPECFPLWLGRRGGARQSRRRRPRTAGGFVAARFARRGPVDGGDRSNCDDHPFRRVPAGGRFAGRIGCRDRHRRGLEPMDS